MATFTPLFTNPPDPKDTAKAGLLALGVFVLIRFGPRAGLWVLSKKYGPLKTSEEVGKAAAQFLIEEVAIGGIPVLKVGTRVGAVSIIASLATVGVWMAGGLKGVLSGFGVTPRTPVPDFLHDELPPLTESELAVIGRSASGQLNYWRGKVGTRDP